MPIPKEMSIICEPNQIYILFEHLIDNAIRYNHSKSKIIHLKIEEKREYWYFSIADNGIGISKEFQKQIFKIFKRLHNSTEYKGVGVGLAISKAIIEKHQGEITIESSKDQGTTVSFTIKKQLLNEHKFITLSNHNFF